MRPRSKTGNPQRSRRATATKARPEAVTWAAEFAMTAPQGPIRGMSSAAAATFSEALIQVAWSAHRRSPLARSAAHATCLSTPITATTSMGPSRAATGLYGAP
jgi:hypothetical protein